jgi:membrane-associated protease RseP (regulator of RpoE activity)
MAYRRSLALLLVIAGGPCGWADDPLPADATLTEQVLRALLQLDDPSFHVREVAADELIGLGRIAIPALQDVAETGSPEVSVRAIDILQRLYGREDEATFEAVEEAFQQIKRIENLATVARAERAFNLWSETRQQRAIVQFERLGGIIHFADRDLDRQPSAPPRMEYFMLGSEWAGGEAGLRLLERIEDIRHSPVSLYIIRGIDVDEGTLIDLQAELPFLQVQRRGPARLGIRSIQRGEDGCIVGGVDPGSAAEQAGLKINDQVLKLDGRVVETFQGLIDIIEKKQPGDRIPLVYRRDEELHEVVVELSAWNKRVLANGAPQKP